MNGKLITFEGIDGSGKSTQIKLISEILHKNNIDNIVIREPGGTEISEKIRNILLDNDNTISKYTEALLFLSSRSQLVNEVIKPALDRGCYILCDRYIDSTIAYQGYGRGIDLSQIKVLNDLAIESIYPDITFILDININTSLSRRLTKSKDRMEQVNENFLIKVRKAYLKIADDNKKRCIVVDCNNKSIIDVNKELVSFMNLRYEGIVQWEKV